MNKHKCEECGYLISKRMYLAGLRLSGYAFCLTCQAVHNIVRYGEDQAKLMNHALVHEYGITEDMVATNKRLSFWVDFAKQKYER